MSIFAKLGLDLLFGKIGGFLKGVPTKVWYALAIIAALLYAWHLHAGWQKRAFNDAFNIGYQAAAKQFNDAQAKADAKARAHVVTTVAKQDHISTESSNALSKTNDDIDARAAAIRLRHDAQASNRNSASGSTNPATPGQAASGPCQATGEDGLSWSIAYPLMVQAEKNQAQLFAILDWEAKQEALDEQERADEAKGSNNDR